MIQLVIFDLDGTLINAYPAVEETLNYTLDKFGFPPVDADTVKRTVGMGDRHLVQAFVGEENIDAAIKVYRAHHADALRRGSSLLPGAREILEFLKGNGLKLAVASNRPKKYSLIVMEHLGILSFFDAVLCGDEAARPKPYPDILYEILKQLQLEPGQAIFVGDMVVDIKTGHAAGIETIAVTTGSCLTEDLKRAGPSRIIDRILDLQEVV